MTVEPHDDDFVLENGRLECPRDMSAASPLQFSEYCKKLIAAEGSSVVIDLSSTRFLPSHHIGVIAHLWVESLQREKKLQVKVSDDLKRTFDASGLGEVIDITE